MKTERGDVAAAELIDRYRGRIEALADHNGGRIIDWAGDGCFLTFETASSAVIFATDLLRFHTEDVSLPAVRIGINIGEVTERVEPDSIRIDGLAVDLASRICSLAHPNQVLMSAPVADSGRQHLGNEIRGHGIRWVAHGAYELKGAASPMNVHEVELTGLGNVRPPVGVRPEQTGRTRAPGRLLFAGVTIVALIGMLFFAIDKKTTTDLMPSAPAGTERFEERPAIAVLPFESISANGDRSFIADGLAEDLIVRLSSWRAFPVIARNSSFKYRGGEFDLRALGAELGVRYVVSGSVRHAGERIRVTAQLIDVTSGQHVWADKYDRELNDVFALQDEISSTIAASLIVDLSRAEGERAHQRATDSLEAWSAYHIGLQHFDRYTLEGFAKAREYFERAVELDPRFATALGQIAVAAQSEIMLGYAGDRDQLVELMANRARRAVELDARDPAAHLGRAVAHVAVADTRSGLDSVRHALELNPSMPEAWIWLGWIQLLNGDPESTITSTERARRLNPKGNLVWVFDSLSAAYWELGRYEEGLAAGERLVALEPSYFPGYGWIAMNAVGLGTPDVARAALAEARTKAPGLSIRSMQDYFGVSRPEIDHRRNEALRSVGLQ